MNKYLEEIQHKPCSLLYKGCSALNPIISFVIPTANRSDTLLDAVKSIVNQKCNIAFEIIILDNSANVVVAKHNIELIQKSVNKHFDYYLNDENIGMVGNFNKCFFLAKANWVAMLHDDDLISPFYFTEIEKYLNCIEKSKKQIGALKISSLTFNSMDEIDTLKHGNSSKMRSISIRESWLKGIGPTNTPTCGMLISKEAFFEVGGFNPSYYPSMDHFFGYQLQECGYYVLITRKILGFYRNAISESRKLETIKAFISQDYRIRRYMYTYNKLTCIYGKIFEPALYQKSIDDMVIRGPSLGHNDLSILDIDIIGDYKKVPFRSFILFCLQKFEYEVSKFRGFK